jgi:hypothetical protein
MKILAKRFSRDFTAVFTKEGAFIDIIESYLKRSLLI